MQPIANQFFKFLILSIISLSVTGKRGRGDGVFTGVAMALPLSEKSLAETSEGCPNGTSALKLDRLCPTTSYINNKKQTPTCLSKSGQRCPQSEQSQLLGVRFVNNFTESFGARCTFYNLLSETVFNNVATLCTSPYPSSHIKFLFRSQINDTFCIFTTQQYNLIKNGEGCSLKIENFVEFPYCTEIISNCSNETLLKLKGFQNFSSLQKQNNTKSNFKKEPLPLISLTKVNDIRRSERHDVNVTRRAKQSGFLAWKEYVLEVILVLIVAIALLIIWLKICLEEKFGRNISNEDLHSRVVRFDFEDKRRKFSQHCVTTSAAGNRRESQVPIPTSQRNPSKPILKNKPKLSRVLNQDPNLIKSFDSNSSIYYDALEGDADGPLPGESGESIENSENNSNTSQNQGQMELMKPLISDF